MSRGDGERPYRMRSRTRLSWADIGRHLDLSDPRGQALSYLQANPDLPPLPPPLTKMEMAYMDRLSGASWEEIRRVLQLGYRSRARYYAHRYAKKHGLKWPIEEEER